MTDDYTARAADDDPDAAPLDIDWTRARLVIPPGKDIITLQRAQGKGYQTLINQVLRAWYDAQTKRKANAAPSLPSKSTRQTQRRGTARCVLMEERVSRRE